MFSNIHEDGARRPNIKVLSLPIPNSIELYQVIQVVPTQALICQVDPKQKNTWNRSDVYLACFCEDLGGQVWRFPLLSLHRQERMPEGQRPCTKSWTALIEEDLHQKFKYEPKEQHLPNRREPHETGSSGRQIKPSRPSIPEKKQLIKCKTTCWFLYDCIYIKTFKITKKKPYKNQD